MERKGQPGRMEQQNLLGGVDVLTVGPRRGDRPLHVDARWKVGFAAALALVVEHGKRAQQCAGLPPRTRCPRCQRTGDTLRDFGIRFIRGRRVPQSWCRTCRSAQVARRAPKQPDLLASTAA
jgi:hypothetical protein